MVRLESYLYFLVFLAVVDLHSSMVRLESEEAESIRAVFYNLHSSMVRLERFIQLPHPTNIPLFTFQYG